MFSDERAACGVGFVASRTGERSRWALTSALDALKCVEHRGACGADLVTGDGAGVMTDIPYAVLGCEPEDSALAMLFFTLDGERRGRALAVIADTFATYDIDISSERRVPVNPEVLGAQARADMPAIVQLVLKRPSQCRSDRAFDELLYLAKQRTRSRLKDAGLFDAVSFVSLSTRTVVYKALTKSHALAEFYDDLRDPEYLTRFALFHRRFSTNTHTSWDKAQPFRLVAHNGEINTIASNRSWSYSREQALGVRRDELLTHADTSDSGNLNEMVEALKYRSSIPNVEDVLAIMMPPSREPTSYYKFWGRAMEPWDGPAFVTYADGASIGARLDRNGFRPCRWAMTERAFYLASEAGVFGLDERHVLAKGTLAAGTGVVVDLLSGQIHHRDPSESRENFDAEFDARLLPMESLDVDNVELAPRRALFGLTDDVLTTLVLPMILDGKEPIGSMGSTSRLALLSEQPRSIFDFFYQDFAQVTNPPLDYLREAAVTDLRTELGRRPNIFLPKELIPPRPGLEAKSPVLSLGNIAYLHSLTERALAPGLRAARIDCSFAPSGSGRALRDALTRIGQRARDAVEREGCSILILSHRECDDSRLPVPSLLALRAVVRELNTWGRRLRTSIVVDAGDVYTTHQVACLVSFGATAVCPRLALEIAREGTHKRLKDGTPDEREQSLIGALEAGLLKVMSKMGISVVRSYQSSKLFMPLGVGPEIIHEFFRGLPSVVHGIDFSHVEAAVLAAAERAKGGDEKLVHTYLFKEHPRGQKGEQHSMSAALSKLVHSVARSDDDEVAAENFKEFVAAAESSHPISLRHLLDFAPREAIPIDSVESANEILRRFGSGAMSFGAISAESQRDLFLAMRQVGGRCNSGEGGENPYYFTDGITATIKQIASARFGVTAEYLVSGDEVEIKIAQGAKPGEGGQLMGVKVNEEIAKARFAKPGVDLISPPPLHDIYSIEDLKQLIYELKQLRPGLRVCVKLVSGKNIGTIAAGVAKAGADAIQISGGDGGTGAATVTSMMHAGLPFEIGLWEAHQTLLSQGLRHHVVLRVDGGITTARDIVVAALLGAEEFNFGKLLLVAQGCIMARVCENNRCPTGIATQDPKFKAKYGGRVEHVVRFLNYIAEDVRHHLARLGESSLRDIVGRGELLTQREEFRELIAGRSIRLEHFSTSAPYAAKRERESNALVDQSISPLNEELLQLCASSLETREPVEIVRSVRSTDRAALTRLAGVIAERAHERRQKAIAAGELVDRRAFDYPDSTFRIRLNGSAGQGFAAFLTAGVEVELHGEANDSVAKSMSGGRVILRKAEYARFPSELNVIAGNCALYGATGGELYVGGLAGDRFAVRNSGAVAVTEGAGLHACEYMTGGVVVILGTVSFNVGAGMTGGRLYLRRDKIHQLNTTYVQAAEIEDESELRRLLEAHARHTGSDVSSRWVEPGRLADEFVLVEP